MAHYTHKVTTKNQAWEIADRYFPTDYMKDDVRSYRAGYPIYYSTAEGVDAYICDLGDRLEVNLPDGSAVNVWYEVDVKESDVAEALEIVDNALYKIEDMISLKVRKALGLDEVIRTMNSVFEKAAKSLPRNCRTFKRFNLGEA